MSLFRRNNGPLIFVLLRVYEEELKLLKKIIVENGGAVRFNDKKMPIIFTQSCNYSKLIWPEKNKTLIYDIKFIKECVRQRKIVDPEPYRLSEMPRYFDCLMSHFLYGGCDCLGPGTASATAVPAPSAKNRQTVVPTQSQTSSVVEEDFFTATSELSERGAGIANPTGTTKDPLASPASLNRSSSGGSNSSTINESQAVAQPARTRPPTELTSGDDRLTEAIDENEKRPCSVEYHTQVEPKLRTVAQRKKDMESSLGLVSKKRQQRTPTTLTDGCDTSNVVPAPENTSAILEEVTRSAPSCENEGTAGDEIKKEPEFAHSSPAKSEASTITARTSEDQITPTARKRLHSETAGTESPPESNWITTDDWQERDEVNHPVSKYMRCDDGERRLLKESQEASPPPSEKHSNCSTPCNPSTSTKPKDSMVINTFSKNFQRNLKSPASTEPASAKDDEKSKYFEKSRAACMLSTSDDSDEDHILITRVPYTREKENVVSVLSNDSEKENSSSKTSSNDEGWNKPGPSGTKKQSSAREEIPSGDSSQDEQHGSELRERNRLRESTRSQNARNGKKITNNKKDLTNGEDFPRLRVRRPSDLSSVISIDDEVVDSISTRTRDKKKENNKLLVKNKTSARTVQREPSVDSSNSDSDRSSYNAKVLAAKNKKTVQATTKSTSGRSKAKNDRTKHRKNLDDDCTPVAKRTKARNGKKRSPSIDLVQVDSDSSVQDTPKPATVTRTKNSGQNKYPSKARNRRKDTCVSSGSESDSSSSSHPPHNADLNGKLSLARSKMLESREDKSGYRTWYTDRERRDIILYIINKKAISLCKGDAFFQVMASEKIFRHRSALSLYNEFHKILKNIDDYGDLFNLTASCVMKFKRLRGDYD